MIKDHERKSYAKFMFFFLFVLKEYKISVLFFLVHLFIKGDILTYFIAVNRINFFHAMGKYAESND